jgi:hypothetical protein
MLLYHIREPRFHNSAGNSASLLFLIFFLVSLSFQASVSAFSRASKDRRYRESLPSVQSRWDCPRRIGHLSCPHGMFPQCAHQSSRSWIEQCRLLLLALPVDVFDGEESSRSEGQRSAAHCSKGFTVINVQSQRLTRRIEIEASGLKG